MMRRAAAPRHTQFMQAVLGACIVVAIGIPCMRRPVLFGRDATSLTSIVALVILIDTGCRLSYSAFRDATSLIIRAMGQFGRRTCIEGKRVHLPSLGPIGLREAGGVNNTRTTSHFYACLRACPIVHVQLHIHTTRSGTQRSLSLALWLKPFRVPILCFA